MKLFSGPLSLYSKKVEIALAEKHLSYDRELVPFTQEAGYAPKHPKVLEANPKGEVPVLIDGNLTLFDSTVILEYLEDAYPKPPLYPAAPVERARCRLLELDADEILAADVRRLMYRTEPPRADAQEQAERAADGRLAEAAIRKHYGRLQHGLAGHPFLCGALSVADIAQFLAVFYALRLRGPNLEEFSELAAWHARIGARPGVAAVTSEIAAADRALSPSLLN
ncbi:MAG: glutathione S-transferase family protein [Acetobacteraceae bacterium]